MIVELLNTDNPLIVPYMDCNNIQIEGRITLLSGLNEIDNEKWERARKNLIGSWTWKNIKEHSVEKDIEEVIEKKKVENGKEIIKKEKVKIKKSLSIDFSEIGDTDALTMVNNCYNLDTLEKWKTQANSDNIVADIDKRIKGILEGTIK